jgi:predicted RecA/RadA family phage recombinase
MASRFIFTPFSAEFPATNFPALVQSNQRPALGYDASTSETAYWTFVAPQGLTGTLTAVISYAMASATTGGVAFDVALEAITAGDATDTDATTSFATVNTGTDTVPGTAGYIDQVSVTLTNTDSVAANDYVRLSVARAVANGSDTATGDCYVLAVEFRDAA